MSSSSPSKKLVDAAPYSTAILSRPKRKTQENAIPDHAEWKARKKEYQEKCRKWDEKKAMAKLQKKLDDEKAEANKLAASVSEREKDGRDWTLSIAVPGSILENAQSEELRTYLAGQIARAATVFCVDEVIVFDELKSTTKTDDGDIVHTTTKKRRNGCIQLAKILQYLECPQYLRKAFFPPQPDLQYAGLLNPLDAPHHLRIDSWNNYREGVVRDKTTKEGRGSYVDIGLKKECQIDKNLQPGVRVTVKLDKNSEHKTKYKGKVVSPNEPRVQTGQYWGYRTRLATCLSDVFEDCPYKEGYDVTVGTSERGQNVDTFSMPAFKHLLVVFGGVTGLETALESDDNLAAEDPSGLFNFYLNTCPVQGSGTIRTEEAILISLGAIRPKIVKGQTKLSSASQSS